MARSRPARRGNNYSDVDRGRVTRALMLADDGVCKSASCNGRREAKRGDRSRGSIASRL